MLKDYFGKEFMVGDKVVYPGCRGSNLWMNDGIVEYVYGTYLEVRANQYTWGRRLVSTKLVQVYCTERVVIIERGN